MSIMNELFSVVVGMFIVIIIDNVINLLNIGIISLLPL